MAVVVYLNRRLQEKRGNPWKPAMKHNLWLVFLGKNELCASAHETCALGQLYIDEVSCHPTHVSQLDG